MPKPIAMPHPWVSTHSVVHIVVHIGVQKPSFICIKGKAPLPICMASTPLVFYVGVWVCAYVGV